MFSRQIEQLARQADSERPAARVPLQRSAEQRVPRQTIRSQTGWALVSVGLKLAASDGR
jgi:hypothetical protein